jgi:hypothetical protein
VPERGSALIGVILLLMMMSALAAALTVSGRTETLVARNHQSAAQARTAAEAGLNHAVQVTVDYLRTIDPDDIPNTLDALLADPTPLAGITFGASTTIAGAADPDARYEVLLLDEDDPDRGVATNIDGDLDATNNEDGNELTDNNSTIVVRAVGYAANNSSVVLEAILSPVPLGAIVTDGDLEISGSVAVSGAGASVHSNGDLTIDGGSATVSGPVTASGEYTGPAGPLEGQPEIPLPTVEAADYRHKANFILTSTGQIVSHPGGAVLCSVTTNPNACRPSHGWGFQGGEWSIGATDAPTGTFYVEGPVEIAANSTLNITIIAEGSIDLSGSPTLTANTDELLFVTDADLDISGGVETDVVAQGQMLVHEQVSISGNATLGGQLIVEDATSLDPLVDVNSISGNVTIDYNGTLGSNLFFVTGWREVR